MSSHHCALAQWWNYKGSGSGVATKGGLQQWTRCMSNNSGAIYGNAVS